MFDKVELPLEELDLSKMNQMEQVAAIEEYKVADRSKGFDFKVAPLMRLAMVRLTEHRYNMIWTYHHILLDGWSMPVLMEEFLKTYEALSNGEKVAVGEEDRFEDYVRYLEKRDLEQEESYWRTYLKDLEQKTLLPYINIQPPETIVGKKFISLRL